MSKENLGKSIKKKLLLICEKIEQVLKEYNEYIMEGKNLDKIQDKYNINSGSKINIIKNLKQNVSLIQNNLDKIYDINKINKIESEIKKKGILLNQLSKEQDLLHNLVQKQQQSIDDYSSKFTTNKEISEIRDKLKFAKEENHVNRETFKLLNSKIKGQLSKIDVLDKKSQIIRQNIEFQQKKQKKEVEKSMNDGEEEDNYNGNQDDLECLMVNEKMMILEIDEEERNYKNEINHQNELICELQDRIKEIKEKKNLIKSKIKESERLKKIQIIKSKEKMINKSKENNKNNRNDLIYKSNDIQKKVYKTNKFIYKIGENPINKNKKENNNIYSITKSSSKPFEIKNFNFIYNSNSSSKIINEINNNFSNGKINPLLHNYNNEANRSKEVSPLKEIEQLKNEIKYTLKNNIAFINSEKGDIINNEKIVDNDKNTNKIIIIEQKTNMNNKKNKPFEKFNFN